MSFEICWISIKNPIPLYMNSFKIKPSNPSNHNDPREKLWPTR